MEKKPENCKGMFGSSGYINFTPACTGGNSLCSNCPPEVVDARKEELAEAHQPTPEETARYNERDWPPFRTLVGDAINLESPGGK